MDVGVCGCWCGCVQKGEYGCLCVGVGVAVCRNHQVCRGSGVGFDGFGGFIICCCKNDGYDRTKYEAMSEPLIEYNA